MQANLLQWLRSSRGTTNRVVKGSFPMVTAPRLAPSLEHQSEAAPRGHHIGVILGELDLVKRQCATVGRFGRRQVALAVLRPGQEVQVVGGVRGVVRSTPRRVGLRGVGWGGCTREGRECGSVAVWQRAGGRGEISCPRFVLRERGSVIATAPIALVAKPEGRGPRVFAPSRVETMAVPPKASAILAYAELRHLAEER